VLQLKKKINKNNKQIQKEQGSEESSKNWKKKSYREKCEEF
jgi:hypothetical protein